MIVYEKNIDRLNNYKKINKDIDCNKFSAIDTITYYDKYLKFSLDNNYTTINYINKYKHLPGKLGCNLSHQLLLENILQNSSTDWNLILEDDIKLNNYDEDIIQEILKQANNNNSKYIQLYTNNKFLKEQKKQKKVFHNLYKMNPQWHTTAYFINKSGINILIKNYPIIKNIDIEFGILINELNSLCWINNIFLNLGSKDSKNKKSDDNNFGSLIWDNKIIK
tara:strand:- start:839 stop:1504 length:666 start_codon:yes stop_codon:yes gene_type:complete